MRNIVDRELRGRKKLDKKSAASRVCATH